MLVAYQADTAKVGGCNFCNAHDCKVTVVRRHGGGIEVRLCAGCLSALKRATGHGRIPTVCSNCASCGLPGQCRDPRLCVRPGR